MAAAVFFSAGRRLTPSARRRAIASASVAGHFQVSMLAGTFVGWRPSGAGSSRGVEVNRIPKAVAPAEFKLQRVIAVLESASNRFCCVFVYSPEQPTSGSSESPVHCGARPFTPARAAAPAIGQRECVLRQEGHGMGRTITEARRCASRSARRCCLSLALRSWLLRPLRKSVSVLG